jgi:hypothetical protein
MLSIPVAEIFNTTEAAAQMSNLYEANIKQIGKLKVVGMAAVFLFSRPELMNTEVPYRELPKTTEAIQLAVTIDNLEQKEVGHKTH